MIEKYGDDASKVSSHNALSKYDYFLDLLDKVESSPFILSDDDDAIERINDRIQAIDRLTAYFKQCNFEHRNTGSVTARATPYWCDRMAKNIASHGVPFSSNDFTALRRRRKYYRDRIKVIQSARLFHPFKINGVTVTVTDHQIRVIFSEKPPPDILTALKNTPLRLKWSPWSGAWVRKFTGQGDDYFKILRETLAK